MTGSHAGTRPVCERVSRFILDTNCIVALLLAHHEHHDRVRRALERRLEAGEALVVAAPTLAETYAVLTRLPAPYRLSATDSRALLEANFPVDAVEVVALSADGYRRLVHEAPERNVTGGRLYDGVIAACAHEGGVDTLLTFNENHFTAYSSDSLAVVVPPGSRVEEHKGK